MSIRIAILTEMPCKVTGAPSEPTWRKELVSQPSTQRTPPLLLECPKSESGRTVSPGTGQGQTPLRDITGCARVLIMVYVGKFERLHRTPKGQQQANPVCCRIRFGAHEHRIYMRFWKVRYTPHLKVTSKSGVCFRQQLSLLKCCTLDEL